MIGVSLSSVPAPAVPAPSPTATASAPLVSAAPTSQIVLRCMVVFPSWWFGGCPTVAVVA